MNIINRVDPTATQAQLGDTSGSDSADPTLVEPAGEDPYYSFDGSDHIILADTDTPAVTRTAGSFTALATVRLLSTVTYTGTFGRIISFESANNNGLWIRYGNGSINHGIGYQTSDLTNVSTDLVLDVFYTVAIVINEGVVTAWDSYNRVEKTSNALSGLDDDPVFSTTGRIGSRGDGAFNHLEMDWKTTAIYRDQALTVDDIAKVAARMEAI